MQLHRRGAAAVRATLSRRGADAVTVELADPAGAPVATIDRLVLRPYCPRRPSPLLDELDDVVFRVDWRLAGDLEPTRRARSRCSNPAPLTLDADRHPDLAALAAASGATPAAVIATPAGLAIDEPASPARAHAAVEVALALAQGLARRAAVRGVAARDRDARRGVDRRRRSAPRRRRGRGGG